MKSWRIRSAAAVLALCLTAALTGCGASPDGGAETGGGSRLTVAVSIVPEQTFVEAVCGGLADVVTLIPPGNSPENYEPTAAQMEMFADSAIYFTIGVPTEAANILPGAGDVPVVSLQEATDSVYEARRFEDGSRDPHIWLSPKRVQVMIGAIRDEMIKLDPEHESVYTENAAAYTAQLAGLDRDISAALESVENRVFIVYHPAFGYLADDYGLTMYTLEEEGAEATASHLEDMIDFAEENDIRVIFYQAEMDSSQSEAFAEEIGGVTMRLEPLAADYISSLRMMAQTMAENMR